MQHTMLFHIARNAIKGRNTSHISMITGGCPIVLIRLVNNGGCLMLKSMYNHGKKTLEGLGDESVPSHVRVWTEDCNYGFADAAALERDFGFTPKITLREGLR